MKIVIKAWLLKKFFRYVNKVISYDRGSQLLITAFEKELMIQANDRKLSVSARFAKDDYGFEIINQGEILIDANLINELVQKFNDEVLNLFVSEENVLQIFTTLSKTNITLTAKEKWDKVDFALQGTTVQVPTQIFSDINSQLAFAVARGEAKPIFQGIGISSRNSYLVASATDTLRLVWKQLTPFSKKIELILPIYTVNEINRLNDFDCEKATLTYTDNQILIDLNGRIKLLSALIDGHYPDLTKQLDREFETDLVCSTQTLIKAIEACSIFREETSEYTSVMLVYKEQKFKVASTAAISKGSHNQDVLLFKFSGKEQKVQFQARFLLETLRSFPSKSQTRIQFAIKEGPILLTIADENRVFNLILPVWS